MPPARRTLAALVGFIVVLSTSAAACGEDRSPSAPVPPASSQAVGSPSVAWSIRTAPMALPDGSTRTCVELTNRGFTALSCLSLPGVSSWVVGGEHFVVTRGADIRFSDGSTIRVDADGVAIGPIEGREIVDEATAHRGCDRRELAFAMTPRFGTTSPAWLPTGCNADRSAVVKFDAPSTNIALLGRDGPWVVLGVVPVNVGCARLEGAVRDACRALSLPE